MVLAPGARGRELSRRVVRPRDQRRGTRHQRRVALAQLLRRGTRLARAERGHRWSLPRRRRLRPHHHDARAEGARAEPPRVTHRPAQRQPVQPAGRVRQQRQPLPRALPLHRPPLVRGVLRLRLAARLLAGRDLRHSVRPHGRDARGRRQSLARHALRHDQPAPLVRRSPPHLEGVGQLRHPGHEDDRLVGAEPSRHHWPQ